MSAERIAQALGGEAYPDGREWRCIRRQCDFATDDDGPDYCPTHNAPLVRITVAFQLHGPSTW